MSNNLHQNIHINLKGGLGNQLFQFNKAVQIFDDQYEIVKPFIFHCSYLNTYRVQREPDIIKFLHRCNFQNYQVGRDKFPPWLGKLLKRQYDHLRFRFNEDTLIDGYYQSKLDFSRGVNHAKTFLDLGSAQSKVLADAKISCDFIAVHLRRGDYTQGRNTSIYSQLDESYYVEGLQSLDSSLPIMVFSDDIGEGNDLAYKLGGTFAGDLGLDVVDEFILMTAASGFVCANSTFSWWASVFSSAPTSAIVRPKDWFKNKRKMKGTIFNERAY